MMTIFKNVIKRVITVIVGILLLVFTLIHVTYIHRGYTVLRGFYALPKNSIDVAVVGTSITFSAFMPMDAWHDYGISSYNYCTNVQFLNSLKYSLKDIERTQNPKVILVDISPFVFDHIVSNPDWSADSKALHTKYNLDSRRYSLDRFNLVDEILKDTGDKTTISDYLYYYFDIVRYHSNEINIDHFFNSEKDLNRGYQHFRHVDKPYLIDLNNMILKDDKTQKPNEKNIYYLKELIDVSKKSKSEVIFFCPPVYFNETKYIRQKNYICEYLENNNCICLDLCDDMDKLTMIYNMDYWNETHFDALGAEKITKYICEYLKKNYDLPDRRKDENYKSLNDDYEIWKGVKGEYGFLDLTSVAADKQKGLIKDVPEVVETKIVKARQSVATKSNASRSKAADSKTGNTATKSEIKTEAKNSNRINNIITTGPNYDQYNPKDQNTNKQSGNRIYSFDIAFPGPGTGE